MLNVIIEFYEFILKNYPELYAKNLVIDRQNNVGYFDFDRNSVMYRICIIRDRYSEFFEICGTNMDFSNGEKTDAVDVRFETLGELVENFDTVLSKIELAVTAS